MDLKEILTWCTIGLASFGSASSIRCNSNKINPDAVVARLIESANAGEGDKPTKEEIQELKATARKYLSEYENLKAFKIKYENLIRKYAKDPENPTPEETVKMGIYKDAQDAMVRGTIPK